MPIVKRRKPRASLLEKTRGEVKKLITVIEHVAEAVIITDSQRRVAYVNPATEKMLGYSAAEMLGRPASRFFEGIPGNPPNLADKIASEAAGMKAWNGEIYDRHKNGQVFPVRLTLAPIRNRVVLGYVGIASDLRAAKKSQQELARSRETLIHLSDAVIIADDRGKIIYVNPAAEGMLDCGAGDLVRRSFSSLFDREIPIPAILGGLGAPGRDAPSWRGETVFRRRRGETFPAEVLIKKVLDNTEATVGFVAIIKDLSLYRRLEQEIGQMKKMESVGLLAGGLAHDFNNFLQMILGNLEAVRRSSRSRADLPGHLGAIEESARRASALCRNLLAFARPKKLSIRPVDVNAMVEESLALLQRSLPRSVSVRTVLAPRLPPVKCNPDQIQQVLFNLAINATEAMKKGGELAFLTSEAELSPGEAAVRRVFPGRYVKIAVRDQGEGMPPRVLKRIFEPFFTTHSATGKTGLGLTISSTIMRGHGGFLAAQSAPGKGTTFEIFLPAGPDRSRTGRFANTPS